jgi:hypothetical protein
MSIEHTAGGGVARISRTLSEDIYGFLSTHIVYWRPRVLAAVTEFLFISRAQTVTSAPVHFLAKINLSNTRIRLFKKCTGADVTVCALEHHRRLYAR